MKILLLNKNPIISKLVKLSAEKIGYDFEEQEDYKDGLSADVIIIDSDVKADLKTLSENSSKLIYLSPKNQDNNENFYISIHKPFLPTDLIKLIQDSGETVILTEDKTEDEAKDNGADISQNVANDESAELDVRSLDFDDIKDEQNTADENSSDNVALVEEESSSESEEKNQNTQNDEAFELDVSSLNFDDVKDEKQATDEGQDENFNESDLDAALKMSVGEKNEKIDTQDLSEGDIDTNFALQDKQEDEKYIFGSNEPDEANSNENLNENLQDGLKDNYSDEMALADEPKDDLSSDINLADDLDKQIDEPSKIQAEDEKQENAKTNINSEDANLESSVAIDKNPYDDMRIDLDSLEFDEFDKDGLAHDDTDKPLESGTLNNEVVNDEENKTKSDENLNENLQDVKDNSSDEITLADEPKDDLSSGTNLTDEENAIVNEPSVDEATLNDESVLDDIDDKQEDSKVDLSLDDEISLPSESNEPDSELPFVVEEKEEEKINFDDIPNDAKFIGQEEEQADDSLDIKPVLLDDNPVQDNNKSVQEQIKEELAILDEMDNQKDDKVADGLDIKVQRTDSLDESFESDLENISQEDMQIALGEIVQNDNIKEKESANKEVSQANNNEIIDELSKSIAGAINSSIKDETLKAALKGMNMNIHININFGEDKA
ncbi:MAG TPA: hypothetical protein K8V51_00165 [Campylobacter avium]|uniref:hypothetical protein n=1 Tax=Campylobacter avium TaxID=522485 RepID=UPI001DDD32C0|nr:hypothetical protein [Campylobacter avium]HJE65460.1 hypothetical protein [Campylobacter avium]